MAAAAAFEQLPYLTGTSPRLRYFFAADHCNSNVNPACINPQSIIGGEINFSRNLPLFGGSHPQ